MNFRYSDGAAAVSPFPCHPGPLRVKVVPMEFQIEEHDYDYESNVKVFHDLMSVKVNDILLVSTPYDAFIMEEDGSLATKIIHEYRGLNLSRPPRITKAFSADEALTLMNRAAFDLVIIMPNLEDMDTQLLAGKIRAIRPELPVILLAHSPTDIEEDAEACRMIDNRFVWSGNSDLLLALVKSVEDSLNVEADTRSAMVRVLILVEDSPLYRSFFLPLIYKVVVRQTLSVLEDSLNEEHRLLKMRARPKILVAENYEEAMALFERFEPYVFGVMSDTRFSMDCRITPDAGFMLLRKIKERVPYLPLLLLSAEPENRARAEALQAVFIDKNSPNLNAEIEDFFRTYLGFGDMIFMTADRSEVGRAGTLGEMEQVLARVPDEPIAYHAERNHFSNWLMARSEIHLASRFGKVRASEFATVDEMRQYIISNIHRLRQCRQKGMVIQFSERRFDPDIMDFVKIGKGSLGGKARGLAFIYNLLHRSPEIRRRYPDVNIVIPRTLVIATDGFEAFVARNELDASKICNCADDEIRSRFLAGEFPEELAGDLASFLAKVKGPLSVRSSSLLEDAQVQSSAGLYKTVMIPNIHDDFAVRLAHLLTAVRLVYASTFFERPLAFARGVSKQFQEDSMAVIVQELAGGRYGDFFYPAISGTAQSRNFYPVGAMTPEDGIVRIGLGLGMIIEDGEAALRFSPRFPAILPQFSTVEDILANAQRYFYALRVGSVPEPLDLVRETTVERREIHDAVDEFPVRRLVSTYVPGENRIRDSAGAPGPKVLTFASVLKHRVFPLPGMLADLLELARKGMGCPVEIEFSVHLEESGRHTFFFLQLRPMSSNEEFQDVAITRAEIDAAFCCSSHAMGHGRNRRMADIVFVKPEGFDPAATREIAREIGEVNAVLAAEGRPYLLAGPGRWGSADPWLGIPVGWREISGVGAMIEMRDGRVNADPSYGSHFFQKITSRGIHYITLEPGNDDFLDLGRLKGKARVTETRFLRHIRLQEPFLLKNDGKRSRCILMEV
ncbi:PEP/pyruvate-binding domain-containing protein [Desulfococcus sp.]|uniref:PEP/pyruvate-binding domain-containing protein n=1 Tax=Desulfococcus sp. TaxID=2025834 RepID=UPI003594920E